jgi:hypothetical protein
MPELKLLQGSWTRPFDDLIFLLTNQFGPVAQALLPLRIL